MTTKLLKRDTARGVVAGVLAGLAEYFDQDPVLFRVIAIVLIILTGVFPGAFIYFIAWLIIPPSPPTSTVEYTVLK